MADRSTAVADASMNVSQPEALKDYVQESVAQGAFGSSASDCVRALVREDRKRQAEARLEALLLEGLDSGDPTPLDAAEWESIRQEVEERIGAKRRPA
jgi:antitoxin ParD1/3/4